MDERSDIYNHLAYSLKKARLEKGLSLDATSKLSGVSKSMVSQIERAESSPTVAILWNLTQALQVDFAGLLDPHSRPKIEVVRADAAPVIGGIGVGVSIRILSPPEAVGVHEVYDLLMQADGKLVSESHNRGCREHLTIIEGSVKLTAGEETQSLSKGDTASYFADRHHSIEANGKPVRAILIVQNS
jgi:XRE family transcriptional regulator, regulator of sulfur utilization